MTSTSYCTKCTKLMKTISKSTPKPRAKVCAQLRLIPPVSLLLTVSKLEITLWHLKFYVIFYFAYSLVNCLNVGFSELITSVEEEGAEFPISITRYSVGSVRWSFLFLWVLRKCCITLLWHFLDFPYNYHRLLVYL